MNVLERMKRTILGQPDPAVAPRLKIVMRGPGRYVLRNFSGQTLTGLVAAGAGGFNVPGGVTMPDQEGREFFLLGSAGSIVFRWDGGKERVPVPVDLPED